MHEDMKSGELGGAHDPTGRCLTLSPLSVGDWLHIQCLVSFLIFVFFLRLGFYV